MKLIINHLRGYDVNIIPEASAAAYKLGMLSDMNVCLNIGGKIVYFSREYLHTKFEYFELFFKYNCKLAPDYSSILIDRCFTRFNTMIYSLEKNLPMSDRVYSECLFYGYRNMAPKCQKVFDVKAFSMINIRSHIYRNKGFSKYYYCSDLPISKKYNIDTGKVSYYVTDVFLIQLFRNFCFLLKLL